MDAQFEFDVLRRERSAWWHIARRKLLREAVVQALHDNRKARVLDFGCSAQLDACDSPGIHAVNAHYLRLWPFSKLKVAAISFVAARKN